MRAYRWTFSASLLAATVMWCAAAQAGDITADAESLSGTIVVDGTSIDYHRVGGLLANSTDYDWYHGCSPTSVGMIVGYYDRNGYDGKLYTNLVPGGVAEASTFGAGPYLVNGAIASSGHITDFYAAGYNKKNDDLPAPWHAFDCLADFMGTSQDSVGNVNGGTLFYYFENGAPLTAAQCVEYDIEDKDGMYGVGEYLAYRGYGTATLYSQYIMGYNGNTLGFTLDQYKAEIDAGRPVLIQVEDHSMFGTGYVSADCDTIYVEDTWNPGQHTMTWGGSYSGLQQYGVMALTLSGGEPELHPVPEPATMALLGTAFTALAAFRRLRL